MTTQELYTELNDVNHSKEKRVFYTNLVIAKPDLLPKLITILQMVNDKISTKAGWVLEFYCGNHLDYFIPHLDHFLSHLKYIKFDSALRPCSKICEHIAKAYFVKEHSSIKTALTVKQKEKIIETCFDWMISEQKVAVQAYAMQTLFLFGKEFNWINPELRLILERNYSSQSAAFKARARHILKKI